MWLYAIHHQPLQQHQQHKDQLHGQGETKTKTKIRKRIRRKGNPEERKTRTKSARRIRKEGESVGSERVERNAAKLKRTAQWFVENERNPERILQHH